MAFFPRSLVLASLAALLSSTPAQATVNIEKYRLAPGEDGAAGSASVSLTHKSGNVDYFETGLEGQATARKGKNLFLAVAAGKYAAKRTGDDRLEDPGGDLWSEDARYANELLGALRYNRDLAEHWVWEIFSQVEYDQFLHLDLRSLGGTGPRLKFMGLEQAEGYLGSGYMLEYERLDPALVLNVADQVELAHRWTSYLSLSWQLAEALSLSTTTYIQPRLTDFGDFRLLNESELSVELSDRFSLGVEFSLRHDSDPAQLVEDEPPLEKTDTELTNKLTLVF